MGDLRQLLAACLLSLPGLAMANCPEFPTSMPKEWEYGEYEDCEKAVAPATYRGCMPEYIPKKGDKNKFVSAKVETEGKRVICYYRKDNGKGRTFVLLSKMKYHRPPTGGGWAKGMFLRCPNAKNSASCPFFLKPLPPPKKPSTSKDSETFFNEEKFEAEGKMGLDKKSNKHGLQ